MTAEKIWEGEILEERVVIWGKDSVELYDEAGYGKPLPEEEANRLEMDLVEAAYLVEKGKLKVFVKEDEKRRKLEFQDLMEFGIKHVNIFHSSYLVYRDLRERGYLCKSGFKFGTVFRVYDRGVKLKRGPKAAHEHTRWIVQPVAEEAAFSLPELSRAVRLAHNIRAKILWAVADKEGSITYYEIIRVTP